MTHFKTAIAVCVFSFGLSTTASAQLFGGGIDNNTILGGAVGSGLGAAIGYNIAPSGNASEGRAIGALAGGLAGAAFGNQRSNYGANPYAGQFNPGFTDKSLLGTLVGAGLGGALGHNIASSGVRDEGRVLGALVGGIAGNVLSGEGIFGGKKKKATINAPFYGGAPIYGGAYPTTLAHGGAVTYTQSAPVTYQTSRIVSAPAPIIQHVPAPAPIIIKPAVAPAPITLPTQYVTQQYIQPRVIQPQIIQQTTYAAPSYTTTTTEAPEIVYEQPATATATWPSELQVTDAHATNYSTAYVDGGSYCYAGSNMRYNNKGHKIGGSCN